MIPHCITHATRPEILQFVYDFDAKSTVIKRFMVTGKTIEAGSEVEVPRLLRYPVERGDCFYAAVMQVREFGEPAFLERWSWDDCDCEKTYEIDHPKFGLTAMAVSPSCELAIVDRYFPTADGEQLGARVVQLPDLSAVGVMPINAGMSSPVFDPDEGRVAMVHYDQDACSANVYRLNEGGAELAVELARQQIVTDFHRACVAFLPGDALAVWSVENWSFNGKLGVYDIGTGEARFVADIAPLTALEVDDEESFSFRLENTDLAMWIDGSRVLVGTVGGVVAVDLADGGTAAMPVEGAGAVVQVRPCGTGAIALDHLQALASV